MKHNRCATIILIVFSGSQTTCNGPLSTAADIAACGVATTDINAIGASDARVVASCLTYVTGSVNVDGKDTSVACTKLSACQNNHVLSSILFPLLTYVTGYFQVGNSGANARNTALTAVDLSDLAFVGQHFTFEASGKVTSLDLPALTYVGHSFNVDKNIQVTSINLPALTFVGWFLAVYANDDLAVVSAPVFTTIACLENSCASGNYYALNLCGNSNNLSFSAGITGAATGQTCFIPPVYCVDTPTTC